MKAGKTGVKGRVWRVFRRNHRNDGVVTQSPIATGILSCEGVVSYTGTALVATTAGIFVNCFSCGDEACAFALAEAAADLGNPSVFYNTYFLKIDAVAAFCEDCDE